MTATWSSATKSRAKGDAKADANDESKDGVSVDIGKKRKRVDTDAEAEDEGTATEAATKAIESEEPSAKRSKANDEPTRGSGAEAPEPMDSDDAPTKEFIPVASVAKPADPTEKISSPVVAAADDGWVLIE